MSLLFLFAAVYTVIISLLNAWQAFSFVTITVACILFFLGSMLTSTGGLLLRCTAEMLTVFFFNIIDYILGYGLALILGRATDIYQGFEIMLRPGWLRIIFILGAKVIQVAAYLLLRRFIDMRRLNNRALAVLFTVTTVAYILMSSVMAMIMSESKLILQIAVILSLCFIMLAIIAVIVSVVINNRYQEKKRQSDLMQLTNRMLEKNYADMQARQETVHRQMHDFKNHLRTINGLVKGNEEAEKYIDELLQTSYAQARECRCGNSVIDAIINCKLAEAQERGITMNYHISVEGPVPVAAVDLCAILSNQLDNAIEACEKIIDGSRQIDVNIYQRNLLLYFKVVNDAPGDPFDEKRRLRTTKDDADGLHGLGVANILDAARRNGGELKNEYKDGKFYSTAMISLEN
ncbi:MAG: GHKL domain-containing protein [Clostridia bacterium]|nr:GHKL domain-containing protein [Clostridia bacterium]